MSALSKAPCHSLRIPFGVFSFITPNAIFYSVSARIYIFPDFPPARFCYFTSLRPFFRFERPHKRAHKPVFSMRSPFRRAMLFVLIPLYLPAAFAYPDP
jgi:hypothetical protein